MYSLRYSKTYNFGIVENNSLKHVYEDKFIANSNMFCVADGVTRDFPDNTPLKYPKTVEEAEDMIARYPNPSGSAKAAQICVDTVISYFENQSVINSQTLKNAVKIANEKIKKLNEGRKINYLADDYYNCVAVGGVIEDEYLKCFVIGDSEIKVLDEDLNVIFDSGAHLNDDAGLLYDFIKILFPKKWNWKNNSCRRYIRKYVRNNRWLKAIGRNNIGSLTGEKKALNFLSTYEIPLKNAKYIFAFSDGCSPLLKTKTQIEEVLKNPDIIKNSTCEKTLVIYEKV